MSKVRRWLLALWALAILAGILLAGYTTEWKWNTTLGVAMLGTLLFFKGSRHILPSQSAPVDDKAPPSSTEG